MLAFLTSLLLLSGALYENPTADRLIRQSMDAAYDLDLPGARTAAQALQNQFPDHPAGFTLMAETYWWEAQTDPGNPRIENAYYKAQELAVEKAEEALEHGKYSKVEVTAYLASTHGSYARFQVTQKEAFFSAMRAGLRAHRYAQQVYELDKNYYDIYVGLGAFNFFTGSLPAVIKPFAFLIGVRGDKELGVQQFHVAMEKSRYARTEAEIVYYTAMLEDQRYAEAFRVLDKLRAEHPNNFVYYVWATDWFRRQRKNLEGVEFYERVYNEQIKRGSPLMAKYALLEKAQLELAHNRPAEAQRTVERIRVIPTTDLLAAKKAADLEKRLLRR